MTEEELITRGLMAQFILDNPEITGFFDELRTDLKACVMNTQPADQKERESLYLQHNAVDDLYARMNSYVQAMHRIEARLDAEAEQQEVD